MKLNVGFLKTYCLSFAWCSCAKIVALPDSAGQLNEELTYSGLNLHDGIRARKSLFCFFSLFCRVGSAVEFIPIPSNGIILTIDGTFEHFYYLLWRQINACYIFKKVWRRKKGHYSVIQLILNLRKCVQISKWLGLRNHYVRPCTVYIIYR